MLASLASIALLATAPHLTTATVQSPWKYDSSSNKWVSTEHWAVGSNFINSNAQNELTMFQADTFDPETIDRELGYAEGLGFNAMRVFLHNLLWEDNEVFLSTLHEFLNITDKHNIGVMFVLLDSCWNADPALGTQPDPIPYTHNSVWMQAPGAAIVQDSEKFQLLKPYVTGVIEHFQNDSRIIAWDLWNEPDNSGYTSDLIAPLISNVFDWAREAKPTQPLTTPVWHSSWGINKSLTVLEQIQLERSDIVSYHNYGPLLAMWEEVLALSKYGKPIVCTEYMAREAGSTFDPLLGYMEAAGVSAFNWGLVSGLTQTIYPWSSLNDPNPYEGVDDPDPWFHDILQSDGTPKYPEEADYIRSITSAAAARSAL